MIDISVILFYNNPRKWLNEARQSYHNQEFSGRSELIEICKNQSTAENLNDGFKRARGKYVKYLCDDDMLLPGCLQSLYDHAEQTNADVVCAGALNHNIEIGQATEYFSKIPKTVSELAEQNTIHGGTTLFKRSALIAVNYLDESLPYGEEYDLYLRLAVAGFKFSELNKIVYYYRIHNEMKSMQARVDNGETYINRKRIILHQIQERYQNTKVTIKVT